MLDTPGFDRVLSKVNMRRVVCEFLWLRFFLSCIIFLHVFSSGEHFVRKPR